MNRLRVAAAFVHLTSAEGVTHLVALRLYEDSLVRGAGRYPAACGRTVLAASMTVEPVSGCALCRSAVDASVGRPAV